MEGNHQPPVPPLLQEVAPDAANEEAPVAIQVEHDLADETAEDDDSSVDLEDILGDVIYSDESEDMTDCFLDQETRRAFLSLSQSEQWKDYSAHDYPPTLTIEAAKATQWKLAQDELKAVLKNVTKLLAKNSPDEVTNEMILMLCLGPESGLGKLLINELNLTPETFLKFMSTLSAQAAYRVSSTALYESHSLLKDKMPMMEGEFNAIWRAIATKKKERSNEIRTARGQTPLWELLESTVNSLLKSVSITGRKGKISIALDDDKIWFAMNRILGNDLFNIKYTTHVKPNRKGIVAHTAVSTSLNIPLGIVFERTKDSTLACFRRLLDTLFSSDGTTDLRNVTLHSDRGYMVPSIVIDYLLANGAEVCGTVKRMAQCWPFTYNQVLKENDSRTLVDVQGAPTLFLKYCTVGHRHLFMSAFRNGSKSVACAVSSLHKNHHWEGVALVDSEVQEYKKDKRSLAKNFFEQVDLGADDDDDRLLDDSRMDDRRLSHVNVEDWIEEEREVMGELKESIDMMTLRQGK